MLRKSFFIIVLAGLALAAFQPGGIQRAQAKSAKTPIFSDGFESGNFSAWTRRVTDAGDLAVTAGAAMQGVKGMRAKIDDNRPIYVLDKTPLNEMVYDVKFHFDPNSIRMANLDSHNILSGEDNQGTFVTALRLDLRFANGGYQLRALSRNDDQTWTATAWSTISDAPHQIEVEWDAASPGQTDGNLKLKIDDTVVSDLQGLDNNNFRIDRVKLGAVRGLDTGTRGTYFFDQFESFR